MMGAGPPTCGLPIFSLGIGRSFFEHFCNFSKPTVFGDVWFYVYLPQSNVFPVDAREGMSNVWGLKKRLICAMLLPVWNGQALQCNTARQAALIALHSVAKSHAENQQVWTSRKLGKHFEGL